MPLRLVGNCCEWRHCSPMALLRLINYLLYTVINNSQLIVYCLINTVWLIMPVILLPTFTALFKIRYWLSSYCLPASILSHLHLNLLITTKTTLVLGIRVQLQCFSLPTLETAGTQFCLLFLHTCTIFPPLCVEFCLQEERVTITTVPALPPAKHTPIIIYFGGKRKITYLYICVRFWLQLIMLHGWDDQMIYQKKHETERKKVLQQFVQPIIVLWLLVF